MKLPLFSQASLTLMLLLATAPLAQAETVIYKGEAGKAPLTVRFDIQLPSAVSVKITESSTGADGEAVPGQVLLGAKLGTETVTFAGATARQPLVLAGGLPYMGPKPSLKEVDIDDYDLSDSLVNMPAIKGLTIRGYVYRVDDGISIPADHTLFSSSLMPLTIDPQNRIVAVEFPAQFDVRYSMADGSPGDAELIKQ
jgi:hypothetical protein